MELEQFVKDALIAIQNGCQQAQTNESKAAQPQSYHETAQGIEFDIGIDFDESKIIVMGIHSSQCHSRLRFFVPIVSNK